MKEMLEFNRLRWHSSVLILQCVESRFIFMAKKQQVYRIVFVNQAQIYEIYAREIYQSDLYGFVEIEDLVFGERSQLVVDPGEEKLKSEFQGVPRSYIPIHSIIRIDEVEKEGIAKVREVGAAGSGKVANFPGFSLNGPVGDK